MEYTFLDLENGDIVIWIFAHIVMVRIHVASHIINVLLEKEIVMKMKIVRGIWYVGKIIVMERVLIAVMTAVLSQVRYLIVTPRDLEPFGNPKN